MAFGVSDRISAYKHHSYTTHNIPCFLGTRDNITTRTKRLASRARRSSRLVVSASLANRESVCMLSGGVVRSRVSRVHASETDITSLRNNDNQQHQ